VRKLRDRARLAPEPLDCLGVGVVRLVEHLECDRAFEQAVAGAVDP
jgi:hypothetical protein